MPLMDCRAIVHARRGNATAAGLAAILAMSGAGLPALAAGLNLQFANLHNPYFPDRLPGAPPADFEHFVPAQAPLPFFGIERDTLPVAFTLVAAEAGSVSIQVQVKAPGNARAIAMAPPIVLYRARDVWVEGNTNGTCACPAGQLPRAASGAARMSCVEAAAASESETPRGCPTDKQRARIAQTLVRRAPFAIKDALEPLRAGRARLGAGVTELFLADIPIGAGLPKGMLEIQVTATPDAGEARSISAPLKTLKLRLDDFPAMDLSYWLSEDPRDLVARPPGVPLGAAWGGAWWSEEHWRNLEHAARLQARQGVTNVLVPLFARSPSGVQARPLIAVRCITGSDAAPPADARAFNKAVGGWRYDFDFDGFHRFVGVFRRAGFRRFEGAHLASRGGELPVHLECNLHRSVGDARPFARNFRFLPRAEDAAAQRVLRGALYREKFLPTFARRLAAELRKAGIERNWYQHVIDENASSDEAIAAYARLVGILREHMPGLKTMDAVNQYSGPRYAGIMDVPVMHLALLYDDQMPRKNIRREISLAFPGPKYLYNTALREGGPNRFLDTNPLEERAYGWLATELGYQGMLYWAANRYRYPVGDDISRFRRAPDWSPYTHSHGPHPNGFVEPAYSPGTNWQLYPTATGLIDSLRARRLRDGLLDHWIYVRAEAVCRKARPAGCGRTLAAIRARLTGEAYAIADISRDPAQYDEARRSLLELLER